MPTIDTQPGRSRPGRPKGWQKGATPSKMFVRRRGDAEALMSSIEIHKARVAEGLGERLAPELAEGEDLPDFALSLELVGRSVMSAFDRLREAEQHYKRLGVQCTVVRQTSEKLARHEVYPRVVSVRGLIDSHFGREKGRFVHGMAGKTLRKARRLHGQLGHLVWTLEEGRLELPAPLLAGVAARREVWLAEIKPGYEHLTELLDELLGLETEEQAALIARDRAMRAFDDVHGDARRMLEATFSFSGLAERLAHGLRSYVDRRRVVREARRKREARAEGGLTRTWRSALSSVRHWVGGRVA